MRNWNRQYRIIAGVPGQEGIVIGQEENGRALHVSFDLQKSDTQSSNTGKLTISNLSDTHISVFESKGCEVTIMAGYEEMIGIVFQGSVSSCSESIDNADHNLEVELIDGFTANDICGVISMTGPVDCGTVLTEVTEQLGIESSVITETATEMLSTAVYDTGIAYVGKLRACLQNVARKAGVSITLQNGVLQVYQKGESVSNYAYVISAETGLLSIPKKITISDTNSTGKSTSSTSSSSASSSTSSSSTSSSSSGTTTKGITGYSLSFFINPAIGINDLIAIKSKKLTGFFIVKKLSIKGDNYGDEWYCTAQVVQEGAT